MGLHLSTLADWMELQALVAKTRMATGSDILAIAQVAEEDHEGEGVEDTTPIEARVDDIFRELERRAEAAKGLYPFKISTKGTALSLRAKKPNTGQYAYLFCLLVSEHRRREFISERVFDSLRSEVESLFQICSSVAAAGLFSGNSIAFGFPRPKAKGFLTALTQTYEHFFCEGVTERAVRPGVSSYTKDGGIDIVAWRDFPDGLPGKLYLVGQCASGHDYPAKPVRVYLSSFLGDWFTEQPATKPLEALFIPFMLDRDLKVRKTETISAARRGKYLSFTRDHGVVIDRCRLAYLVDTGMSVSRDRTFRIDGAKEILKLRKWVDTALRNLRAA
jgi:hypothetical protein